MSAPAIADLLLLPIPATGLPKPAGRAPPSAGGRTTP